VAAWRAAYPGILSEGVLRNLSVADRAERWRQIIGDPDSTVLVLERHDAIAGFGYLRSAPYADGREDRTGELDSFNLDPSAWGTGAARRLFDAVLERARGRGFEDLALWVFGGNERAKRFYEKAGMQHDGTVVSHPRFRVPLLRYAMPVG
jgi:GNAT superfamily N-acetyltransferase